MTSNNKKKVTKAPQKKCARSAKKTTTATVSCKKGSKRCACKVTTAASPKKIQVCNKKGQSCSRGQVKKTK